MQPGLDPLWWWLGEIAKHGCRRLEDEMLDYETVQTPGGDGGYYVPRKFAHAIRLRQWHDQFMAQRSPFFDRPKMAFYHRIRQCDLCGSPPTVLCAHQLRGAATVSGPVECCDGSSES